jgi:hypothetical protein
MGYHEDPHTRSAFLVILTDLLRERSEWEVLGGAKKEERCVVGEGWGGVGMIWMKSDFTDWVVSPQVSCV